MLVTIAFTACLLAKPDECTEQAAKALSSNPAYTCMVGAQEHIAKWQSEHPAYFIKGGWRCLRPGTDFYKS